MKLLRTVLLWCLRGLLWLLLFYWAIFAAYTAVNWMEGGPQKVAAWYKHVFQGLLTANCADGDCTFIMPVWSWRAFWAVQAIYLAITLLLIRFELRSRRK